MSSTSAWKCAVCGLQNSIDRKLCQACFTESPSWKACRLRDKSDEILWLLYGYIREIQMAESSLSRIPDEIRETIRLYSWCIPPHSLRCIQATHMLASEINKYMNSAENKCEFSGNLDLNILEYIFIRGGALRDTVLLRKMKDVDLVVNIHELNLKYLQHLQTYHATKERQDENKVKCVFWRHYLNKYKSADEKWYRWRVKQPDYSTNNKEADKINKFEQYIEDAGYVLNARFLVDIIVKLFDVDNEYGDGVVRVDVSQPYFHHWQCVLVHMVYDGMVEEAEHTVFDIANQTQNAYGRYMTYKEYLHFQGLSNMEQISRDIDEYHHHLERVRKVIDARSKSQQPAPLNPQFVSAQIQPMNTKYDQFVTFPPGPMLPNPYQSPQIAATWQPLQFGQVPLVQVPQTRQPPTPEAQPTETALKEIMLPIFPFPMHVRYYDLTINSMHIDLLHVLKTKENDMINYHWDKLIVGKQYNHDVINRYNVIGMNDIIRKTLVGPSLEVLNKTTADFYFWRLVKCAANFIDQIEEGVWQIDETYLQRTISLYPKWFSVYSVNEEGYSVLTKFMNKFVKWGLSDSSEKETRRDIINRFKVLRYIKFEPYLVRVLQSKRRRLATRFKTDLKLVMRRKWGNAQRKMFQECFKAFGYPHVDCAVW